MTNFVGDNDHGDALPPSEVLFKEVLELRKRLDETRRLYCNTMSNVTATYVAHMRKTPEQIAKEMGWDCFRDYDKANEALDKLSELDQELGLI